MAKFEILPGLPPYGPSAEAFSPNGQGSHREGLVVRFFPTTDQSWFGNFQRGYGGCNAVFEHPDQMRIMVVSGGQGYIVNPETQYQCTSAADIQSAHQVPELNVIVLGNGLWFEAIAANGLLWRSGRISWDDMCDLVIDGLTLSGKAWDISDQWIPFTLDLSTGEFVGGTYSGPERQGQ